VARIRALIPLDGEEEAGINLTPLIDVVFVVLIMFIVVAPLLRLENVQLAPGTGEKLSVREASSISIHVKEDNTIWINQRQVDPSYLERALCEARQSHPAATPQLFQDWRAQFGSYQRVKNAAEAAGFEELELVLDPS
jgi:biopolymer transport protein ExbD